MPVRDGPARRRPPSFDGDPVTDASAEPVSRLRWYPDRGFELDLNASVDDVTLALVAVPLPVDGTRELRAGPVVLDALEILFKAQVDVDGVPGQLVAATVRVQAGASGEEIVLDAEVEDAETGDRRELRVHVAVSVPATAPDAGGPRPRAKDEADLDWDDEDTIEAYFKDPLTQEDPLPVAERKRSAAEESKKQERGFNRLMEMLMRDDDELDDLDDLPSDEAEPSDERPPPRRAAPAERPVSITPVADPADARGLLQYLVDQEQLELDDGGTVDELVAGAAQILASARAPESRAQALSAWLFTQDAVAELYVDDDALAELIASW